MIQFFNNFLKYKYLMGQLVKKNIKLRYRRSYLGMLWTLIEPLLTMIVLSVVFGSLLGRNSTDAAFAGVPFPIYVLTGRLLYSFFSSATNSAMRSIRTNGAMIKKVYVPKYIYPFSGILANFIIFLIILSTGVGMILSTLCVFFRDIEYLWSVMLMLIMYCSAIFYFASNMSGDTQKLVKLNPLFGVIDNFRRAFFGQPFDMRLLLYTSVIGMIVFYRKQDSFILNI